MFNWYFQMFSVIMLQILIALITLSLALLYIHVLLIKGITHVSNIVKCTQSVLIYVTTESFSFIEPTWENNTLFSIQCSYYYTYGFVLFVFIILVSSSNCTIFLYHTICNLHLYGFTQFVREYKRKFTKWTLKKWANSKYLDSRNT